MTRLIKGDVGRGLAHIPEKWTLMSGLPDISFADWNYAM
jgi:hypothetical protein